MPGEAADTGIAQGGLSTDRRVNQQIEQGKKAKEALFEKLGPDFSEEKVSYVQGYFSLLEQAAEVNPNQQAETAVEVITGFAVLLQNKKAAKVLDRLIEDPSFNSARTAFMDAAAIQAANAKVRSSIISDATKLSKGGMPGTTDWMRAKGINRPSEWDEISRKGRQL